MGLTLALRLCQKALCRILPEINGRGLMGRPFRNCLDVESMGLDFVGVKPNMRISSWLVFLIVSTPEKTFADKNKTEVKH